MKKKRIDVSELAFGMYVSELDRPWTDTPFMFQGFVLRSEEEIATLRKFCKYVIVDDDRSELSDDPTRGGLLRSGAPLAGTGRIVHAERVSVEVEIAQARDVVNSSERVLQDAIKAVHIGGDVNAAEVRGAVTKMTESVIRNPDALVLITALRERGGYFLNRSMNASVYMIMFARFLGMEQKDIEKAGMVGMLQDIAMVRLPDAVVNKKGPLTPEEQKLMRTHVEAGAKIIADTHGLGTEISTLALVHHERHDGSGYPKGLRGEELVTLGAVAGLIDTYGAMTTARPYADPMSPSNAVGMLHKWRGRAFHADLVEEFIRCIGVFPVGSVVELNTGEVGIVISQNLTKRLQPRVMVVRDPKGQPLRPQKLLDLSKNPKATADEPYRIRKTLEYGRSGVGLNDVLMV